MEKTMKVVKVTCEEATLYLSAQAIDEALEVVKQQILDNPEEDLEIIINYEDMDGEEFYNLPEFDGF